MIFNCSNSEFKKLSEFTVKTQIDDQPTGELPVTDILNLKGDNGIGVSVDGDTVTFGIDETTFPDDLKGGTALPEVTEADNGKIQMVVGGQWENVKFPAGPQKEFWVVTALANDWTETIDEQGNTVYENWVYDIEKSMENCKVGVALHAKSTAEQIAEARRCGVYAKSTDMSQIIFITSYDTLPTCDLKFKVEIERPNTLSYSVDDASMTLTITEGYNDGQE